MGCLLASLHSLHNAPYKKMGMVVDCTVNGCGSEVMEDVIDKMGKPVVDRAEWWSAPTKSAFYIDMYRYCHIVKSYLHHQ